MSAYSFCVRLRAGLDFLGAWSLDWPLAVSRF